MHVRRRKLEVQALCSIAALAQVANVSRQRLAPLLHANRVQLVHIGRAVRVPMSQNEEKIPLLWQRLCSVERARGHGEEVKELCKQPARPRWLATGLG